MDKRYKIYQNYGKGDMHGCTGLLCLRQDQMYGILHNALEIQMDTPLVMKLYYGHVLVINEAQNREHDPVVQIAFAYSVEDTYIPTKADADAIVQQYMGT